MCHGLPQLYPCGHIFMKWHHCPAARIDLKTGFSTPCEKADLGNTQKSPKNCPLSTCDFRNAGGNAWICCKCGRKNTIGWCTGLARQGTWELNPVIGEYQWVDTCDHGCCVKCEKNAPTPSESEKKTRADKTTKSRRADYFATAASSSSTSASASGPSYEYGQHPSSSSTQRADKSSSKSAKDKPSTSSSHSSRREHKHKARSGH